MHLNCGLGMSSTSSGLAVASGWMLVQASFSAGSSMIHWAAVRITDNSLAAHKRQHIRGGRVERHEHSFGIVLNVDPDFISINVLRTWES